MIKSSEQINKIVTELTIVNNSDFNSFYVNRNSPEVFIEAIVKYLDELYEQGKLCNCHKCLNNLTNIHNNMEEELTIEKLQQMSEYFNSLSAAEKEKVREVMDKKSKELGQEHMQDIINYLK